MSRPGSFAPGRGRGASRPWRIPAQGWRDVALRLKERVRKDKVSVVAAGVAFFALLALFPALGAAISLYGLVANPADVREQLSAASGLLPDQARELLDARLGVLAAGGKEKLGLAAVLGLLLALWSAAKGVKTLIMALNLAYHEEEKRGLLALNGVALVLTAAGILFGLLALGLVVVAPVVFDVIGPSGEVEWVVSLVRWPILAVLVVVLLAMVYRYGPSRRSPRWQWTSYGALGATALWLVGSILFSAYVANFGRYDATYGSLGAVVILMLWLHLSAFFLLLGAELNAELERQTARDSTVGTPKPMGEREARAADTVGEAR